MAITAPTTMLEAVNELLTAIGTTPVNNLDAPGLTDAAIAKDVIENVGREIQSRGWAFNTERSYTLTPSSNKIAVPSNATRVTPALPAGNNPGEPVQFTIRSDGGTMRLYNLITNSFTFTATVKADIVWLYAFEALPESARRYITIRAARIFQTKVLGDDQLNVFTTEHEQDAYIAMEQDHLQSGTSTLYLDRMRAKHGAIRIPQAQPRQRQQG